VSLLPFDKKVGTNIVGLDLSTAIESRIPVVGGTSVDSKCFISNNYKMDIDTASDSGPEEVLGGGNYAPNARIVKLEEEAFLESLKQYKHVQPRIGKTAEYILMIQAAYLFPY